MLMQSQSPDSMPLQQKYTLMNIDIEDTNQPAAKYEVNITNDTLLVYYDNEVQVVSLTEMQVERIIEQIPCQITSIGSYHSGVYVISNTRRQAQIVFYNRDTLEKPTHIAVESRILAHLSCDYDEEPYVAVLCSDYSLKIYKANTGERIIDKKLANLEQLDSKELTMHLLKENKWISIAVEGKTLLFVDMSDWHCTYPISDQFEGIEMVFEVTSNGPNCGILWEDFSQDKHAQNSSKVLSLLKLPPENDEGTYVCENHRLPVEANTDILDCIEVESSILLLLQNGNTIKLLQFLNQPQNSRFNLVNQFTEDKYKFIFARIIPDTFYTEGENETGAGVYLFFPRCQNIGIYEFTNQKDLPGSIEHAQKFNEHIKSTSNRNMLQKDSTQASVGVFSDEEILNLLQQGYFEQIGS